MLSIVEQRILIEILLNDRIKFSEQKITNGKYFYIAIKNLLDNNLITESLIDGIKFWVLTYYGVIFASLIVSCKDVEQKYKDKIPFEKLIQW